MPLSKDPETLKIPAFMRKRSLRVKKGRPLLLTALDRKKAGILPKEITRTTTKRRRAYHKTVTASPFEVAAPLTPPTPQAEAISMDFWTPSVTTPTPRAEEQTAYIVPVAPPHEPLPPPKRTRTPRLRKIKELIAPPTSVKTFSLKEIGRVTHFFAKISVAVIALSEALTVGDTIHYQTIDGKQHEQMVKSLEIERNPIFKAEPGDDVGLKLERAVDVGTKLFV